jgi:hypothetical protein
VTKNKSSGRQNWWEKAIAGRHAAQIDSSGQHSQAAHPDQADHADSKLADCGRVRKPGRGGRHRDTFASRPVHLLLHTSRHSADRPWLTPVAELLRRFGRATPTREVA